MALLGILHEMMNLGVEEDYLRWNLVANGLARVN